jgi:hypothetical protein
VNVAVFAGQAIPYPGNTTPPVYIFRNLNLLKQLNSIGYKQFLMLRGA